MQKQSIEFIDSVLSRAIEIADDTERHRFVRDECGGDAKLLQQVEGLVAAHFQAEDFLEHPTATISYTPTEREGDTIGPYKLREQIGEGGFGVVYVAEQEKPVARKVALKIIKPGMDTREVIARFEAERQALALMDHPNIAKVLDAGTTSEVGDQRSEIRGRRSEVGTGNTSEAGPTSDLRPPTSGSGRPYFVMELVRGVPITEFCDERTLSTRDRLQLFIDVCRAVQHAHQKGIIHRDLKPSNVMVTLHDDKPVVKVIDFGISKALSRNPAGQSVYTAYGQMIGTPLYMSPEQAQLSGLDVDTRSDVYSLGVLLYELLTGTTPFEKESLQTAGFDEMRRIIREVEPPRPSARISTLNAELLSTVSDKRKVDPRKLSASYRGELDWIVMQALEKDRNRRYESASAFAADVERYLADEPVQACPPSVGYRLRKFARRNRRALLTSLLGTIALLLTIGAVGWAVWDRDARRQESARHEAERLANLQQEVTRALVEAQTLYKDDRLPQAMAAVKRAEALMSTGRGSQELRQSVVRWRADLAMVERLEDIRAERASDSDGDLDESADEAFRNAFRSYGLNVETLQPDVAGRQIRKSAITQHLVAALDEWALTKWALSRTAARNGGKQKELAAAVQRLLTVVRLADPDPFRNRLRQTLLSGKTQDLVSMTFEKETRNQPVASLLLLDAIDSQTQGSNVGEFVTIKVLRETQRLHPDDFWINYRLASRLAAIRTTTDLSLLRNGAATEAVGYCRSALALRPNSYSVRMTMGVALTWQRRGTLFGRKSQLSEAEAEFRDAIRLRSAIPKAHYFLGVNLLRQRRWAEAEAEIKTSLRLKPRNRLYFDGLYHAYLGDALSNQGKRVEAAAAFRKAVGLMPDAHDRFVDHGRHRLQWLTLPDDAELWFRMALGVKPGDANARANLDGLARQRKLAEAEAAALRILSKQLASARRSEQKELYGEAARGYLDALRAKPELGFTHRVPAARVAALAGARKGQAVPQLDEQQLAFWRRQSLAWLTEELQIQRQAAQSWPLGRDSLRGTLNGWQRDAAFAGVRGVGLAKLPKAESEKWRKFWEDVAGLLRGIEQQRLYERWYNQGLARQKQRKYAESVTDLSKAIEQNPRSREAYIARGNSQYRLRRYAEAAADFTEALALTTDRAGRVNLHGKRAAAFRCARQWGQAIAAYREASRLAPTKSRDRRELAAARLAHAELAWLLATCPDPKLRNADEAVKHAGIAIQVDAKGGEGWRALGAARFRKGDWDAALAALEQASRRFYGDARYHGDPKVSFFLAMVHRQRGEQTQARLWYDRAVQRTPFVSTPIYPYLPEELDRFRTEAVRLLGIKDSPGPRPRQLNLELAFVSVGKLLLAGDVQEYRRQCGRMLEHTAKMKCRNLPGRMHYLLARVCLLAPRAAADPAEPGWLAEWAALRLQRGSRTAWRLHTLGLAHYRNGRYADAVTSFEQSLRARPDWSGRSVNWLGLAMSHHALNIMAVVSAPANPVGGVFMYRESIIHAQKAREWLRKATLAIDADRRKRPRSKTALGMHIQDWVACQVLRREAEQLINGGAK
jgi:eukaryotic-like serine/threonine-protein kinase